MKTLAVILLAIAIVKASRDELRLLDDLVVDGPRPVVVKMLRPVQTTSDAVDVGMSLSLTAVGHIGSKTMPVEAWTTMTWTDAYLRWEPVQYGGIDTLRLEADRMWTPDIMQFTGHNVIDWDSVLAVVKSDGAVTTVVPFQFEMECNNTELDSGDLQHECSAKFGSWTYPGREIDMPSPYIDLSMLSDDRIHDASASAVREAIKYDCCPDEYVDNLFTIRFKTSGNAAGQHDVQD